MFDSSLILYLTAGIVLARIVTTLLEASFSYYIQVRRHKKRSNEMAEFLDRLKEIQKEDEPKPAAKKTAAKKKTTTTA
jgi:uncharacterized membrane protein affecting hemolysin expression